MSQILNHTDIRQAVSNLLVTNVETAQPTTFKKLISLPNVNKPFFYNLGGLELSPAEFRAIINRNTEKADFLNTKTLFNNKEHTANLVQENTTQQIQNKSNTAGFSGISASLLSTFNENSLVSWSAEMEVPTKPLNADDSTSLFICMSIFSICNDTQAKVGLFWPSISYQEGNIQYNWAMLAMCETEDKVVSSNPVEVKVGDRIQFSFSIGDHNYSPANTLYIMAKNLNDTMKTTYLGEQFDSRFIIAAYKLEVENLISTRNYPAQSCVTFDNIKSNYSAG